MRLHIITIAILLGLCQLLSGCSDNPAETRVDITISSQLPAEHFSANWPLHIYLSAPGSKIPLSSTTITLADLPYRTTLTEKDYVLPAFTLKGFQELVLVVKVSSSGDPHRDGPEDFRQQSPRFQLNSNNHAEAEMILKLDKRSERR